MATTKDTTAVSLTLEEREAIKRASQRERSFRYRAAHRADINARDRAKRQQNLAHYRARDLAKKARHLETIRVYGREYSRTKYQREKELLLARMHEYYLAHKEERARYNKAWIEQNKEAYQQWYAAWYEAHKEERRAQKAVYYAVNKSVISAKKAAYYRANPDKQAQGGRTRRAREAQISLIDLTVEQWLEIKQVFDFRCAYCGKKPRLLTQDHITPVVKLGPSTLHNIVPACQSCNSKKHAGPVLSPVQPLLLTIAAPKKKRKKP